MPELINQIFFYSDICLECFSSHIHYRSSHLWGTLGKLSLQPKNFKTTFEIYEPHRHNLNLVGASTILYRYKNGCQTI